MQTGTLVSLQEYLSTSYRPDVDYVEGELLERNMGERDHAWLQGEIVFWLRLRAKELRIIPLPEIRVQIRPDRFRIPDIAALSADAPFEPIIRHPPVLCIEILSPEDRMKSIMRRVGEYLEIGVPTCWVLDPIDRLAWIADADGLHEVKDGVMRAGNIVLPLSDIWPESA